jgi:hypothetical protein
MLLNVSSSPSSVTKFNDAPSWCSIRKFPVSNIGQSLTFFMVFLPDRCQDMILKWVMNASTLILSDSSQKFHSPPDKLCSDMRRFTLRISFESMHSEANTVPFNNLNHYISPYRLWGPSGPYPMGTEGYFPGGKTAWTRR